jgi:AcrR family transcriptional regulator
VGGTIVNSLIGIHTTEGGAMPRSGEATRLQILDAAYKLFRRSGFSRVSMDEIAAATGVTKRTLYYHFESKDQLLAAVLEAQHALAVAAFRTFGDRLSGSPEAMVEAMFRDLAVWSDRPRWAGSGFTRLVVELADLPGHPARAIARRHKATLEDELARLPAWRARATARARSGSCQRGRSPRSWCTAIAATLRQPPRQR